MKNIKSHFWYTKSQRNGILLLIMLIIIIQILYYYIDFSPTEIEDKKISETIKAYEKEIDSLRAIEIENRKPKIYPFNPNFISDYKGYQLGMSIEEIDRLHTFRKKNKYVNSPKEFQQVTQVSDSLLNKIAPYFKFPDWVKKSKVKKAYTSKTKERPEISITTTDLNKATLEDFKTIHGVGEKLAGRIIKYRSKLKGFSYEDQLFEVWGLNKDVATKVSEVFKITTKPTIVKINVNTANFKEVLRLPYIDYDLCKRIFEYRDEVAELQNISELRNIKDFPQNKYDRIVLYLKAE
ncbi:ComEA family DNA-binding protein [Tenacibaculum amylolyticum]|uniref:ComEA family DNA-binding protein n=1 Tax=Tenacibaculum amylolyticum TaxID=104269 RepID=UPI003894D1C2